MSLKSGKILIIDDNEDILFSLKLLLKGECAQVDTTKDPEDIPRLLKENLYDVILLDMNFKKDVSSGQEGFQWLQKILEIDGDSVVIFITAYGDIEKSVRAIKEGATDFILKPWQNEKLMATISSAVKLRKSKLETRHLKERQQDLIEQINHPFPDIIGNSPAMQEVYKTIQKVSKTGANVLILGENGTGKELIARAIHNNSHLKDNVFITVDLGTISDNLFESELFGHVKGAFTDARKDRAGRFEIASGGTLFLDEIGNLSPASQAKLLTAVEKQQIIRVGSNKPIGIDVRLISATNMPLHKMVKDNSFRQDLLYRINTVEIHLPPLRDRKEDFRPLVDYFLKIYSRKYRKKIAGISKESFKKMKEYRWPGNIRELQHAIERSVILSESKVLESDMFSFHHHPEQDISDLAVTFNLEEMERRTIEKVLKKVQGNISQAAKELGLTRTSLYRRLEKYGL